MPDNILSTVENDPKFRALPSESRKKVIDSLLNEDTKFKALDTKAKSTVQQKLYHDFASSPQQQQIDHARQVAHQAVARHISPNAGSTGTIQYPHTAIGPPPAPPQQGMMQRFQDALSTPAAMLKSAVQPLAAQFLPDQEPPISPLTGDKTDRYEELRVAAMPYWDRVQYMKSQPMKHVANPSKQYQDQVWLDKQPVLSRLMSHAGEVLVGMASDPTAYALGAGWLSKAPKLMRATSATFATMQVAPYIANPSMLKDPKALIDIPLALLGAWHAAGLKMPALAREAVTRSRAKGTGGVQLSKGDVVSLAKQFADKEYRYNIEFKSGVKPKSEPGIQKPLPHAGGKEGAIQKQGPKKSVSRRQRPKVELQGVGEGHAKEAAGTRKGKTEEVKADAKPKVTATRQANQPVSKPDSAPRPAAEKQGVSNVTPTQRPKPGSVPGEREANAAGRVPARPSTGSSKAGADKGAAAPVQSNKVQGTKSKAQIDNLPSLAGETKATSNKPTHVNRTVFRQSIDKLKALGHDVEHLEGGYLLYNQAKTPADIKAASLALRDELQKTAAKTPARAPSKPAQAAKPVAGTDVSAKRKPTSAGHVEINKEQIDENIAKDFPGAAEAVRDNGGASPADRQAVRRSPQGWEAAGEARASKNIPGKQRPSIVVGKHTGTVYITDPMTWHLVSEAGGSKNSLLARGFFADRNVLSNLLNELHKTNSKTAMELGSIVGKPPYSLNGAPFANISKFRVNPKVTDVVRHELTHEPQAKLYNSTVAYPRSKATGEIVSRSGRTSNQIADHMDDPVYAKVHQKLSSMGYSSPDVEAPVWITAGQHKSLGLTDSEAAQILSQYIDDVSKNYGSEAAQTLFKRATGPARAVSRAARARRGMASFGGPGRPGSPQARVTSAAQNLINRVKSYAPTEKTGGRYHMTAVIDPQTADLEHTLSNTDSYGDQLGSQAFRRVTAGLDAKEREDFVRFMQSNNLAVDNPAHPSVLTNRRMENIWGRPGVPLTVSQAKIQAASILHSEVQSELFGLVKKGKPSVKKKVGLTYSGPAGEDLFMNMIPKKDAAGNPVMINPKPGAASRRVASQMKVNPSKAALPRAGTAAEYETDLEKIYQQAYKNALPGAVKSDIYAGMAKKGLAKYTTGAYPKTITYNGVDYPATTELVRKGKKPGEVGTIDINITMPAQIHADIKDATSAKPFAKHAYIDPNAHGGPKIKSSSPARDVQNALTDAQLASPKVITGHSLRVITMVTKIVDPSLPSIRRAVDTLFNAPTLGIAPRLTRLYDLANLDPTSTAEYTSKEGYKYSNQSIRIDLARANAVDNRTFDNTSALGKVPGIKQMREMGHGALFFDPKGPSDLFKAKTVSDLAKSIQEFGLDIRAKVMIEKVRRMADGYDPKDPELDDKIRNNAYKLGEYVKKPNKYVEFLKTLNTYAGTSAPMRKTELQQFFGNTGISGKALSPAQREVYRAQTLAMSGIGTFMGYVMWNKLLSGHMPWDNKSDNTLELGNGWHLSMSAVNPADTRAMSTLGLLRSARGLETGNYSDIPKAVGKGVIGAGVDLVTGPGVKMMGTAAGADLYLIDPNGNAMLAKAYPGAQYPLPGSLYDDDDSGKDTYAKRFRAVLGEVNPVGETFMDLLGGSSNSLSALRSPRSTYDSSEVNPWDSLWRHVKSADTLFNSPLIQRDKEPKASGEVDPVMKKIQNQQQQYERLAQPKVPVYK